MGVIRLGAVKVNAENSKTDIFVEIEAAGNSLNALVDTGASDLFIAINAAKINLKVDSGLTLLI